MGSRELTAATGALVGYYLVSTGAMSLDLDWGRRTRPLGPITIDIRAARETVFDVVAEPYMGRQTHAMAAKLKVLERGSDMVLAEHYTPLVGSLVTTTTETVRFAAPERVDFRLVRGPVPYVCETFMLSEVDGVTTLDYRGELGTDLWSAGRWWGNVVAKRWEATVFASLTELKSEAERRSRRR